MTILSITLRFCVCTFSITSVYAATLIVTTTADSGAGSLRDSIAAANEGDTIQFDAALKGQTIALTSAELLINKSLTIHGPGAGQLTVKRSTAGGTPDFRIFEITPDHTVTINGITISNGSAHIGSQGCRRRHLQRGFEADDRQRHPERQFRRLRWWHLQRRCRVGQRAGDDEQQHLEW